MTANLNSSRSNVSRVNCQGPVETKPGQINELLAALVHRAPANTADVEQFLSEMIAKLGLKVDFVQITDHRELTITLSTSRGDETQTAVVSSN